MTILILTKNEQGGFTRWAETDNMQSLYNLVPYFASSCYCEDFIIYHKETNKAYSLLSYCEWQGIPVKYRREV